MYLKTKIGPKLDIHESSVTFENQPGLPVYD